MPHRVLGPSYPAVVRQHIALLTIARLCANACYRFAAPFLATIALGTNASLDQLGIAIAISELCGLMSPLLGRVVDRLSRRLAMVLGLSGVAIGTSLAASSHSVALFAVALVVIGQTKVMFDLGLGSWIADHVPYQRRSRVVGITETSWALGLLVGVSLMGLVTAATNWRVGYGVGAAAVVVMAGLVSRRIPSEPPPARLHESGSPTTRVTARSWLVVGGAMALMASTQCLFVTFGSWLHDDFAFGPAGISVVVFALGFLELGASLTSAKYTDIWGKERSAAMGALVIVPAALGLALWHDVLGVGVLMLGAGICGFEFAIVSALAIGSQMVAGSPARGLGLLIGGGTLGRALASVPATRLYESRGIGGPAVLAACLASVTVIAMRASHRMVITDR